jgi:hypothetical protein
VERLDRRLVLARRVRALVVAGVLALPSAATAASLGPEVDSQDEGLSTQPGAPGDQLQGEQVGNGPETEAPVETPLPVEVDPIVDPDDDAATGPPAGGAPSAPIPLELAAPDGDGPGAGSTPQPVEAPAAPQPPDPALPLTETPAPGDTRDGSASTPLVIEQPGTSRRPPHLRMNNSTEGQLPGPAARDQAEVEPAAAAPRTGAPPASVLVSQPAARSATTARFRVVRPGESLWSIAADLLGPGASATTIAHQVQRLWKLNRDAIGSGDPNVLPAGVRLRLK